MIEEYLLWEIFDLNRLIRELEMTYIYTDENRLKKPHSYMYSEYSGSAFIEAYFSDRISSIRRLPAFDSERDSPRQEAFLRLMHNALETLFDREKDAGEIFRRLVVREHPEADNFKRDAPSTGEPSEPLTAFRGKESIESAELLRSLTLILAEDFPGVEEKYWIDRLVHRFEISKKLYEFYNEGIGKGSGSADDAGLYWLFALVLCLYYLQTSKMKYASTLLKCTDLLCSLPVEKLRREIPGGGLSLLLIAEITCMQLLAEKKGIYAID